MNSLDVVIENLDDIVDREHGDTYSTEEKVTLLAHNMWLLAMTTKRRIERLEENQRTEH